MKKVLFCLLVLIFFTGCKNDTNINVIKNDYESLNDKYYKVEIKDNKLKKIDYQDFDNTITSLGAIYFCLPTSNYCRKNIEVLIELVNDLELDNVYYIDISNKNDDYDKVVKNFENGLKEGDLILFNNGIKEVLTTDEIDNSNNKLNDEERKKEYNRLYNVLSKLNDSEFCEQDSSGC